MAKIHNSAKASGKRARAAEASDSEDDDYRPGKRAKTSGKTRKRRTKLPSQSQRLWGKVSVPAQFKRVRGQFALLQPIMTDVPIKVVLKIFCHLDSRDILILTRTSKKLRGILMSKSTSDVWRAARENVVGLPPLPSDLNEPQYAHLIFDAYCHMCDRPWRCDNILWRFRLRCCCSCEKNFPLYQWNVLYDTLYLLTSFDILPKEKVKGISGRNLEDLIYNGQVASKFRAQFMALQSQEERCDWVSQKREERQAIEQHARQCEAWHTARLNQCNHELNELRNQRLQAILTRLETVGWRGKAECVIFDYSDLKQPHEFLGLQSVKSSKKLTDHAWVNLQSELVNWLSEHRIARLNQVRKEICQRRCHHLKREYLDILAHCDLRNPYPGVGDILTDRNLEALIWDTDAEEGLMSFSLRLELLEHLPRILREWRSSRIQELLQILRAAHQHASHSDLHLATTVFGCVTCQTLLVYPQVFYHRCCFNSRAEDELSHDRMQTFDKLYYGNGNGPWSARTISFHSRSSQFAEKIVINAGLDPATATVSDLTVARPVIEHSNLSADVFPTRIFVNWQAALTYHALAPDKSSFIINQFREETSRIRAHETLNKYSHVICCVHCHKALKPQELPFHLNSIHNMEVAATALTATEFYELFRGQWYWNPCENLNLIGMEYLYR
ncbi:MAG: hypothetical protein NXY57DRAFT_968553 [Lentinula lateritia]|nr:MAG: hypothetical protein NXY57DRAFT_968553 [Lentinula lateritia]